MKNIEYLTAFFKKHNIPKCNINVDFFGGNEDEDMCSITFQDMKSPLNLPISLPDIRFDIDTNLPEYSFNEWMEYRQSNNISYIEWFSKGNLSFPKNIDTSSIKEYQKELTEVINNLEKQLDNIWPKNKG